MGSRHEAALITGASSGIGHAIARHLAHQGYTCVLTARREDRLRMLAQQIEREHGTRCVVIPMDLGMAGAADALYDAVAVDHGITVDVLVNNAGFGCYGPFLAQDWTMLQSMLDVDLIVPTRLTHRFARDMVARGHGRILQVASIAAFQPSPLYAAYAASKAYLLFLSQALHRELAKTGVTVTTLCPGLTASEFHEVAGHLKPGFMRPITMHADEVARKGLDAMWRGQAVCTPGLVNKGIGWAVKLIPRSVATRVADLSMRPSAPEQLPRGD